MVHESNASFPARAYAGSPGFPLGEHAAAQGTHILEYFPKEPCTVTDCPFFRKNDSVFPKNSRVFWGKLSFHAGAG